MEDLGVIISMMIMCLANVIIKYDRNTSELPSAPLNVEYDDNITEQ